MSNLLENWEEKNKKEIEEGSIFTSYGWRSKKWLKKKGKKLFSKKKNTKEIEKYEEKTDRNWKLSSPTPYYSTYSKKEQNFMREEYDDYNGFYDYGFETSAISKNSAIKEYEKTGQWKGYNYYQKASIDYKYIEQMANAFSAKSKIKIQIGKEWNIDLENKILTYNPVSLMFGTRGDVIISLLHEITHLTDTTPYDKIKITPNGIAEKYREETMTIHNIAEDIRIDNKAIENYEGAKEMKTSIAKWVDAQIEKHKRSSKLIKDRAKSEIQNIVNVSQQTEEQIEKHCDKHGISYEKIKEFKKLGMNELVDEILKISKERDSETNLHDICATLIAKAYERETKELNKEANEIIENNIGIIKKIKQAKTTQKMNDILEKELYPKIEKILENSKNGSQSDISLFGKQRAAEIQKTDFPEKDPTARGIEPGDLKEPEEWREGEYNSLKDSVSSAIRELIRRMKIIKVDDTKLDWETKKRRGKINIKELYKHATGGKRIFKQKKEKIDRIRKLLFTLIIDTSGSMQGSKIINAARGTILISETLERLNIPYEIILFDTHAKRIKDFEEPLNEKKRREIGGIVKKDGASTELLTALKLTKIHKRQEKSKQIIILTDGATSDQEECKEDLSNKKEKYNIDTIGIELTDTQKPVEASVLREIMPVENIQILTEPNSIPVKFEGILKNIIRQLK